MSVKGLLVGVTAALGLGWIVYRSKWFGSSSAPREAPKDIPPEYATDVSVKPGEAAAHKWARPIVTAALRDLLGREPSLAEVQYGQAIGWLESSYGRGWGKLPKCAAEGIPHDQAGAMASNNWGAVHAKDGQPGFAWSDTKPDRTCYAQKFRSYATPEEGARDKLRHTFVLRQKVARAVSGKNATVWRASLAMRRGMYYGSWCDKAVMRYGQAVARPSVQKNPTTEGELACEREAAELHAKRAYSIIRSIAASLGEPVAMPLGTYEDARSWFDSLEVEA